jgi:hypothetical protein
MSRICLLLIAALIPLWARAADPTQEEAILALKRAGIEVGQTSTGFLVSIKHESDDAPAEVFKNLQFVKGVNEVFVFTPKAEARLALIADLPDITYMTIHQHVTDRGLRHLSKHTKLKRLSIYNCERISDAGLVHLQTLTRLESLKLLHTKVTKQGINKLYMFLPKCLAELN